MSDKFFGVINMNENHQKGAVAGELLMYELKQKLKAFFNSGTFKWYIALIICLILGYFAGRSSIVC